MGPGQRGYKPGWINVDANFLSARIDVWADLRNRLPFRDDSVDVFYSHHVIEHLPDSHLSFHIREMYRCLKPGGVIRVGGPNGDEACRNFLANNHDWFSDFPDKRGSIGGRLVNFLLCRGEHLTILTRSYLAELLEQQSFDEIVFRVPVTDTGYPERLTDALSGESESTPNSPHTLLVEAMKPKLRS
ncbi:MAG: methyltransferase domain-containing protein [Burkholderiales bacterium]|nr:methyltransferase domain-containing protein [Burkholderiales bacterium]